MCVDQRIIIDCESIISGIIILYFQATIQTNLSALLEKFERPKYSWMRKRIQEIFPHWIRAVEELGSRVNLHGRRRKKV